MDDNLHLYNATYNLRVIIFDLELADYKFDIAGEDKCDVTKIKEQEGLNETQVLQVLHIYHKQDINIIDYLSTHIARVHFQSFPFSKRSVSVGDFRNI